MDLGIEALIEVPHNDEERHGFPDRRASAIGGRSWVPWVVHYLIRHENTRVFCGYAVDHPVHGKEAIVIRSCLLLLSLPFAATFAQSAPVYVLVSSPNRASFQISIPSTDSGRGPIIGRGRVEYAAELGDVFFVSSRDSLTSVHVDATQNGRVIASGDGAYVVVHREATGVAIEARSQIPPSAIPEVRKPK